MLGMTYAMGTQLVSHIEDIEMHDTLQVYVGATATAGTIFMSSLSKLICLIEH